MIKRKKSLLEQKSVAEKVVFGIMFIVFLIWAVSFLYPLVWLFTNSLKHNLFYLKDLSKGLAFPTAGRWEFENYLEAFEKLEYNDTKLLGMIFNSVWYCVVSIGVNMFFSACTGYVLSKYKFKGRDFIYSAAIVCMTIPIFGTGGATYTFYYVTGMYNTPIYVIFSSLGAFGVRFLMLYSFFKSVSWEYAEAVFLDGGFENFHIENIEIYETRMCGIAIESVDGAIIEGITIKNVKMRNVNTPLFIHLGKRMRGPFGREIGEIKNVLIENVVATGPYEPYEVVAWNYASYIRNDFYQKPWVFGTAESFDDTNDGNTAESDWQMTSNVCGLAGRPLKNIVLRNIYMALDGGVQTFNKDVPEEAQDYPEVYVYGRILPAKGIYFRYVDGLVVENVTVETNRPDVREACVFEKVNALEYK